MSKSLEKLQFLEDVLGKGELSRDGLNVSFRCPFCAKTGSSKKKLVVHLQDDLVHCWVCGWSSRSTIPLLRKVAPRPTLDQYAAKFTQHKQCVKQHVVKEQRQQVRLPPGFMLLVDAPQWEPDVKGAWYYLQQRGLTIDDVWRYRMGVTLHGRFRRRIIVPSFDADGTLNFFSARAIDKDRLMKYDSPKVDKLSVVFNEVDVDWDQRVTLCEGVFDAFVCGENAIPLLGSDISEESYLFGQLLLNDTHVALALDSDMLGSKVEKVVKLLESYCINTVVVDLMGAPDPGSMTREQFSLCLKQAKRRTWRDSFKSKLDRLMKQRLVL